MVRVTYDPAVISFAHLLEVFFAVHDPTTLNRQGADVGTQYRSAIFFADEEQARVAREVIARLDASGEFGSPIVTADDGDVLPRWPYLTITSRTTRGAVYCRMVIAR
jgi:methionine-S-sulfoxide reductase